MIVDFFFVLLDLLEHFIFKRIVTLLICSFDVFQPLADLSRQILDVSQHLLGDERVKLAELLGDKVATDI